LLCWQGAADRPVAAIFHFSSVPNGISVQNVAFIGRRLTQAVGRHLQAISIFITGCLVLSRLGAPPQNYRRSRRAYSPAPASCTGV
jgi:hypothetical protein